MILERLHACISGICDDTKFTPLRQPPEVMRRDADDRNGNAVKILCDEGANRQDRVALRENDGQRVGPQASRFE